MAEFLSVIPENCLFNKKRTGCGATELAIRNDVPTIIAMPHVALVKNKSLYRKDGRRVLGVYEGVTEKEIADYANTCTTLKIATTYDALPRVVNALCNAGKEPYKDVFLLIDESHDLFYAYKYRYKAIDAMLYEVAKFHRVTCMSATPIERKYLFDALRHLPTCEIS